MTDFHVFSILFVFSVVNLLLALARNRSSAILSLLYLEGLVLVAVFGLFIVLLASSKLFMFVYIFILFALAAAELVVGLWLMFLLFNYYGSLNLLLRTTVKF